MTIILQRGSNSFAIDQIQAICQAWIFQNISSIQRNAIMEHLAWMKQQADDLHVNCRIETNERKRSTRIILEASFNPLQSWKLDGSKP